MGESTRAGAADGQVQMKLMDRGNQVSEPGIKLLIQLSKKLVGCQSCN